MGNGSELKSIGAQRLRAAGYKPCPRWWLNPEQMELLAYMARQNEEIVNFIRAGGVPLTEQQQREKAWKEHERQRQLEGGTLHQDKADKKGT